MKLEKLHKKYEESKKQTDASWEKYTQADDARHKSIIKCLDSNDMEDVKQAVAD